MISLTLILHFQAFLEFRESVGEIFLILKHAHCTAGHNPLLSISQSNEDDASENLCPSSPQNATCANWPMMADRTEEVDKEEEDQRNYTPFKTICLSSPKLNDFQEADMFAKNFATFLSSLKSNLSDEMRLGTEEEEEKERFAVYLDYNDVHQIDLNPVHKRRLETDGQLNFSFTDSGRIPLMSRIKSKWTADQGYRDGLALSTTDAQPDANFKTYSEDHLQTCYSVNSTGSTSNVMHFKTISNKSPFSSSSTDKLPLGIHNTLSEEGDMINDCSKVLYAEDISCFSNNQEIEEEFRPLHLQKIGSDDGLTVTTCCRTQMEFGDMLPSVGNGRMGGKGNDPEMNYVDPRRFRQPVQSLTLDGDNFSVQKSNRNFSSDARSRHCKSTLSSVVSYELLDSNPVKRIF